MQRFSFDWFVRKETANVWTASLKSIPTKFGHDALCDYLIHSRDKTFDKDSMRAYKSLKAFKYFEDGYVQKLRTALVRDETISKDSLFLCKAQVMASMAKKCYNVFVCINKTSGYVEGGSCQCVAGKGEACSHVAAVLFALEEFISRGFKEAPEVQTVTDKFQKWNQPAKRKVEGKPIKDIAIYKPQYGVKKLARIVKTDPRHPLDRSVDEDRRDQLHTAISRVLPKCGFAKYGKPGVLTKRPPAETVTNNTHNEVIENSNSQFLSVLPPSLEEIRNAGIEFMKTLTVTKSQSQDIEMKTLEQSKCKLWHEERYKRLTASNFHAVFKRRLTTDPTCLLKRLLGYTRTKQQTAMKFGLDSENQAADRYQTYMSRKLNGPVVMKEAGFRISESYPFLGASADRIAEDSERGTILVELKNPLSTWHKTIKDASTTLPCLKLDENNMVTLNRNHQYYTQVQGQMGVYNIGQCDFVLCTKEDIFIETITFDEELWKNLVEKLTQFYTSIMLPELVYPSILLGNPPLVV